jgi:DNA-binding NarL/FixJ family response regulator
MPRSVLIVDDHPSFRSGARLLLESEGYDVVGEAEDGAAALREAGTLAPDVILLDVQLPDMDGFRVAACLREAGVAARIVLTSSRDSADYGTLVERSGATGFVPKGELSGEAIERLLA